VKHSREKNSPPCDVRSSWRVAELKEVLRHDQGEGQGPINRRRAAHPAQAAKSHPQLHGKETWQPLGINDQGRRSTLMAQTADNSCGIRIGRMRWASIRRSLNDIPRSLTPHHCSHCSASDIGLTTHTGSESRAHLRSGRCEPNSKSGYGARTRGHPPNSSKPRRPQRH
jgi:hypothetical protein